MSERFKKAIGTRLRQAREAAEITAEAMADRLGCSDRTVYAYERGQNLVPVTALVAYADATGKPLDWFRPDPPAAAPGGTLFALQEGETASVESLSNGPLGTLARLAVAEMARRLG